MTMTNKEKYELFCQQTYVPIYSKPWWMDTVCGAENWDVWLYESGGNIMAAMPYYRETRGAYQYITKPPLTQHNGIIFREDGLRKAPKEAEFQEKVIRSACTFIQSLKLDVYEQQYAPTFQNWSPFSWEQYTCVLRYTYMLRDTSDMAAIWDGLAPAYRNEIRKGQRNSSVSTAITPERFYDEHEKVFLKQGRPCPFSREFWYRLYAACREHAAGQMFCSIDENENILSLLYLVWDERSVYHLLGGYMPEFSSSQAYPALIYHGIEFAHDKGLAYDFEGSMLPQVQRSFRQFGGTPMPYYRIRKVFNPAIVRREAEDYIRSLQAEDAVG